MRDSLDYVKIIGLGVDALEARKEHGEVGPEITEAELAKSLRLFRPEILILGQPYITRT